MNNNQTATLLIGTLALVGSFLVPEVRELFGIERRTPRIERATITPDPVALSPVTSLPATPASKQSLSSPALSNQTYRITNCPKNNFVTVLDEFDNSFGSNIPWDATGIRITRAEHRRSERFGDVVHVQWGTISGWITPDYLADENK